MNQKNYILQFQEKKISELTTKLNVIKIFFFFFKF